MVTKKETKITIIDKLQAIQYNLKAPKTQRNSFGKYNYRSCEDILESIKPLLRENDCIVNISDEVIEIGGRIYLKATATIKDNNWEQSSVWYARESLLKKWMDEAQITGAASSYARKYALNWLLAIDDTKDSDLLNIGEQATKQTFTQENYDKLSLVKDKYTNWISALQSAQLIYFVDTEYQTKILNLYI